MLTRFPSHRLMLLMVILLLIGTNVEAQLVPVSLDARIKSSEVLLEGRVVEQYSFFDNDRNLIYTANVIEVKRTLKGTFSGQKAEIITLGGIVGNQMQTVSHTLELKTGDFGLFMCEPARLDALSKGLPRFRPYADAQGFIRYDVQARRAQDVFNDYGDVTTRLYPLLSKSTGQAIAPDFTAFPQEASRSTRAVAITNFTPTSISAGAKSILTINGSGFGATQSTGKVEFRNADNGGVTLDIAPHSTEYISWSDTQIQVYVPSIAGTGEIRVTGADGTSATSGGTLTITYNYTNTTNSGVVYQPDHVNRNLSGGYTFSYAADMNANSDAKDAFMRALASWRCATFINWDISSTATGVDTDANDDVFVVRFGSLSPGTLGICRTYYSGCSSSGNWAWYVEEMDVTFSESVTWNYTSGAPSGGQNDFESVALHELGHGHQLGHVISLGVVMHYALVTGTAVRTLTANDISGGNFILTNGTTANVCGPGPIVLLNGGNCSLTPTTPCTPGSLSPAHNATNQALSTTLSWSCTGGNTSTYDVYFGTSSNPPLISNDQAGATYNPGTLAYSTTYYWKIVAQLSGNDNSTTVYSFTTLANPNKPAQNLTATTQTQNVLVDWDAPNLALEGYISWDTGTAGLNLGVTGGGTLQAAARFPSSDLTNYVGNSITQVRVQIHSLSATYNIRVWKGGSLGNPGTMVYDQAFTPGSIDTWVDHTLTTPVLIEAGAEYWIGYQATHGSGISPVRLDSGPIVADKGGWVNLGSWSQLTAFGVSRNVMVRGYVAAAGRRAVEITPIAETSLENPKTLDQTRLSTPLTQAVETAGLRLEPALDAQISASQEALINSTRALTGYRVERRLSGGSWSTLTTTNSSTTAYTDVNPGAGTWCYRVIVTYDAGDSDPTSEQCAVVAAASPTLTSVTPNTAAQGQTLTVSISGSSTSFSSGTLTCMLSRIGQSDINSTGRSAANNTSMTADFLIPVGTAVGAWNVVVSDATDGPITGSNMMTINLGAPTGLSATTASATQINLSWSNVSTTQTQILIERKTGSGGTYAQIATAASNATTYSNTGLTANTQYFYRIRATDGTNNSAYSSEANAMTSQAALSVNDVTVTEGNSGSTNATFTVTLSTASSGTVTVNFATSNNTATANSDYSSVGATLTFTPGQTAQTTIVNVLGDTVDEIDETFFMTLTGAVNATISDNIGVGTITDDDPAPVLSINDVSVAEGNSGSTNATFTVTLTGATAQAVTVNYATSNGTATASSDYTTASGPLTFTAGQTSQTFNVAIIGDTVDEANETLNIALTSPTNATIGDGTGIGTINDDDPAPTLSIGDVSVTEGNSGSTNATFTVTLTGATAQTVTVNYATSNGTATASSDYTTTSGTLTFTAGQTTQTFNVAVIGDAIDEANETFNVTLTSPTNATFSDSIGVGTITDDDPAPALSINDVSVTEGNSGSTNATFTVTLTGATAQTVTVNYATNNSTATAGSDYTLTSGTLTFTAGQTTQNVIVSVTGDTVDEPNETFTVTLSGAVNATISNNTGAGTITDDDAAPVLSINDVSVTEGNSSATSATFTVTLTGGTAQTVTVNYATSDGTGSAVSDYISIANPLTFTAGQTTQTLNVVVNGDFLAEDNETFTVRLSSAVNATISDSTGVGTITNDDAAGVTIVESGGTTNVTEGGATDTYTAVLTSQPTADVTITPAPNAQVTVSPTSLTFTTANWNSAQTVTVTAVNDVTAEGNHTGAITHSASGGGYSGATIAGVTVNITDNDFVTISVDDVTVTEGNSGASNATFTVSLSAASGSTVTVNYATSNGTATAGSDYTAASGALTFTAGQTSQTFNVSVLGDLIDENNETFTVTLSSPTNAAFGDSTGVGTISDDDGAPTLSVNDVTVTEGNSGSTNATFTVSLSAASGNTVTVNYATSNGTATSGSDYTAASGALTFSAGVTTQTFNVSVLGDLVDENNENYTVRLSGAANATISDSTGVGTITDDDGAPTLSVNDVTVTEGNSGSTNATFTVSLSAASGSTVTVNYATSNGTATSGSDYTAASGALTFNAGVTTQTFNVSVLGDLVDENNEIFTVTLSNPANAAFGDSTGVGTITDDDGAPTLSVNDVTVTEGNSGSTNATFTVSLSAASGNTITVNYATSNGTATSGSDYTAASGALTFTAGQTSQTFNVAVLGDLLDENNETYTVQLSGATNATISDSTGVGTITDDDGTPTLSVNDVTVTEGNSGSTNATFTVSLSAASGNTVTVNYATSNGTATSGSDYSAASGTLTFSAGQTSQTFNVAVLGDLVDENNETYTVRLSGAANATISDSTGVGTITDDDAVGVTIVESGGATNVTEGGATDTYTVVLTSQPTADVTITPSSGTQVSVNPTSLTFTTNNWNAAQTVTVTAINDAVAEGSHTGAITHLASGGGYTGITIAGVTVSITDNDFVGISVNDVSAAEGSGKITFAVTLSAAFTQPVTVAYTTQNGSAVSGSDYTAANGSLTFTASQVSRSLEITLLNDNVNESTETFTLKLSNPTQAILADSIGVGTIFDDDGLPVLSVGDVQVSETTATAAFTVTLNGASALPITVSYATGNGTAQAGSDFTTTTGTLNFAVGQSNQTISVPILNDSVDEPTEVFTVTLSTPINATLADSLGLGTILDDDSAPNLRVNDATVTEGGAAQFTVTLTGATAQIVTVNYATSNGTATAGSDYTTATGLLTFAVGQSSQTITVGTLNDVLDEPDETFTVSLSAPVNATFADSVGLGTITDDDNAPTLAVTNQSAPESAGTLNFTVTLTGATAQTVTVAYTFNNDTAQSGSDFTATPGSLTFTPGQNAAQISVAIVNDAIDENDETFTVTLSNPVNAQILTATATGTILDNDTAGIELHQSSDSTQVAEGGATDSYTLILKSQPTANVTITLAPNLQVITDLAALTFTSANWNIIRTVTVTAVDDTVFEGPHTTLIHHTVTGGDAKYNGLTLADVAVQIVDNDLQPGDVNGDGHADQEDLHLLILHIFRQQLLSGQPLQIADANHDGVVNILDILWLLRSTNAR